MSKIKKHCLLAFLLGLSLQAAAGQTPKTAEDYNNRGLEPQGKGDLACRM
jgi:hypothetical protein